jgi:hypothetical protein
MNAGAAEDPRWPDGGDLLSVDELIRRTPGAHPISSVDELRCDAFETDKELDEFLAFVSRVRRVDVARPADANRRP